MSAKVQRKKNAKTAKLQSANGKSRNLFFFLPSTLKAQFQTAKQLGRKRKGLE
jgi:hypothetical protein